MNSPRPDIAFDDLLSSLQKEGFKLSPTDYVEFTAVFNQFTGTREELKYYLAPILCRNQESQLKFYALYDRFTTPPETTRHRTTEPTTNSSPERFLRRWCRHASVIFAPLILRQLLLD